MAHDNDLEYEVGYRKPPKAFQFQKGHSGNPSGRPREVPGIRELYWKVAKQKVLVNGKNGPIYITKREACITQLANQGAMGNLKAAKLFIEMPAGFPEDMKRENMEAPASSAKAKLFALVEARNDSPAEDEAEPDQRSEQANAIPNECDRSGESSEESGRRQPPFPSAGEHDSARPLNHHPAPNSTSPPPPAPPLPDGGADPPP